MHVNRYYTQNTRKAHIYNTTQVYSHAYMHKNTYTHIKTDKARSHCYIAFLHMLLDVYEIIKIKYVCVIISGGISFQNGPLNEIVRRYFLLSIHAKEFSNGMKRLSFVYFPLPF